MTPSLQAADDLFALRPPKNIKIRRTISHRTVKSYFFKPIPLRARCYEDPMKRIPEKIRSETENNSIAISVREEFENNLSLIDTFRYFPEIAYRVTKELEALHIFFLGVCCKKTIPILLRAWKTYRKCGLPNHVTFYEDPFYEDTSDRKKFTVFVDYHHSPNIDLTSMALTFFYKNVKNKQISTDVTCRLTDVWERPAKHLSKIMETKNLELAKLFLRYQYFRNGHALENLFLQTTRDKILRIALESYSESDALSFLYLFHSNYSQWFEGYGPPLASPNYNLESPKYNLFVNLHGPSQRLFRWSVESDFFSVIYNKPNIKTLMAEMKILQYDEVNRIVIHNASKKNTTKGFLKAMGTLSYDQYVTLKNMHPNIYEMSFGDDPPNYVPKETAPPRLNLRIARNHRGSPVERTGFYASYKNRFEGPSRLKTQIFMNTLIVVGNVELFKKFVELGFDVDVGFLMVAIKYEATEIIDFLVKDCKVKLSSDAFPSSKTEGFPESQETRSISIADGYFTEPAAIYLRETGDFKKLSTIALCAHLSAMNLAPEYVFKKKEDVNDYYEKLSTKRIIPFCLTERTFDSI